MHTHKTLTDEARETFSKVVENVGPAIKKAYHDTETAVEGAFDSTTGLIKKHPVQSVLIGFGVGCLCGFALRKIREN